MTDWEQLGSVLNERQHQHLYRKRRIINSPQGAVLNVDGREVVNFCSNDYLGLANHPAVVQAMQSAANEFGVGSGASHLVCGHSQLHHQLEEELADFTGRDRALLLSTGYMANLGVISALLGKSDYIFEDKLNHASLLDAGLASGARFQRFLHNDVNNLAARLAKVEGAQQRKLIVVDSVFSMDGDLAPLAELSDLANRNHAWLMIDDAHGFGVLGKNGAGSAEHFGLSQQQLPVLMATLGKALGTFGAFIAGSHDLIETLIQFARPYIYTTALPPAIAAASLAALGVIREDANRREYLHHLIALFRREATAAGLNLCDSQTAIQPLIIGDSDRALAVSEALLELGFFVAAIRPPTVPANTARLRITLSAAHTEDQVRALVARLAGVVL